MVWVERIRKAISPSWNGCCCCCDVVVLVIAAVAVPFAALDGEREGKVAYKAIFSHPLSLSLARSWGVTCVCAEMFLLSPVRVYVRSTFLLPRVARTNVHCETFFPSPHASAFSPSSSSSSSESPLAPSFSSFSSLSCQHAKLFAQKAASPTSISSPCNKIEPRHRDPHQQQGKHPGQLRKSS